MPTSIKIIDESGGKRLSGTTVATLQDSPFKTYVNTVTQHISTKIDKIAQGQAAGKSCPVVELFFVYRPLIASVKSAIKAPVNLARTQSNGARYLDSPWVQVSTGRSPKFFVRAVFVWSERQFLLDQALMSGARVSPAKPLLSIDERTFGKYIQDYTDSVLLAASPEARSTAQVSISKRLPPEILWLFRHAWQSTRGPFSMEVDHALRKTVQRGAIGYTDLTKSLVDQFFASTKTETRYASVLDLKNVFTPDRYRINQLH